MKFPFQLFPVAVTPPFQPFRDHALIVKFSHKLSPSNSNSFKLKIPYFPEGDCIKMFERKYDSSRNPKSRNKKGNTV